MSENIINMQPYPGWAKARGCKIEHDAAMAYGIDIICD